MFGDFPPNSKVTFFKFPAAALTINLPTSVDPIKLRKKIAQKKLSIQLWTFFYWNDQSSEAKTHTSKGDFVN